MNMRDKNGETASERIARKAFEGHCFTDCNTTVEPEADSESVAVRLYGTKIASIGGQYIAFRLAHPCDGTMLTKSRKRALEREALRRGYSVWGY